MLQPSESTTFCRPEHTEIDTKYYTAGIVDPRAKPADDYIRKSELPTARLAAPSDMPWAWCDYSCMSNFHNSVRTKAGGSDGVLEVDVQ
eukprot:gene5279-5514_t